MYWQNQMTQFGIPTKNYVIQFHRIITKQFTLQFMYLIIHWWNIEQTSLGH
jgi:hypothetical protein